MVDPDCGYCPECLTPHFGLMLRGRKVTDSSGREKVTFFTSCECGAYTHSPQDGRYNLRGDVAEAAGIKRKTSSSVQARIKPIIRKKGA